MISLVAENLSKSYKNRKVVNEVGEVQIRIHQNIHLSAKCD